jgi:prevent-host-death family protein
MNGSESSVIGAYEAKTRFSQLLERVAMGEEITITRHGQPVARLVPPLQAYSIENRKEAIRQMRDLACRNRLDGIRVQDLIAEGRR